MKRDAIQGTLMRSTIHMVSRADYPMLLAGVRSARQEWWLRVVRHQAHGLDMDVVAGTVRERLSHGPARAAELKALLAANGIPAIAWSGLGLWPGMIPAPPSGTSHPNQPDPS